MDSILDSLSDLSSILLGIPAVLLVWAVGLTARQRKLLNVVMGDETREGILERLGIIEEEMVTEEDMGELEQNLEQKIEENAADPEDMKEVKGMLRTLCLAQDLEPEDLGGDGGSFLGGDDD